MLDGLKRLFSSGSAAQQGGLEAITSWAETRTFTFRPMPQNDGFIIDGRVGAVPWRLEWGPSQRPYIEGGELRLRAELGLGKELQVVVLNKTLQEAMEKAIFEQYVEDVQTRIDNETPPEMRWLVMFPKLSEKELGRLKDRFAAVGNSKGWLSKWVGGPLGDALMSQALPADTPLVLMVARGRLMLRAQVNEPTADGLEAWVKLFETALSEARDVAEQVNAPLAPSTQPSLFTSSELPLEETPH